MFTCVQVKIIGGMSVQIGTLRDDIKVQLEKQSRKVIRGISPRYGIERSEALVDTLIVIADCYATLSGKFAKCKNIVHSPSEVVRADVAHYLKGSNEQSEFMHVKSRVKRQITRKIGEKGVRKNYVMFQVTHLAI